MTDKKTTRKPARASKKAEKPETQTVKAEAEKHEKKSAAARGKYVFAVGRRKTAIASVKLYPQGSGKFMINKREFEHYFPSAQLQRSASLALDSAGFLKKVDVEAKASGGGVNAQAEAIRLGISRALVKMDAGIKTVLKKQGLMTRDSRKKERKKPGLKRARRAPQWQKR